MKSLAREGRSVRYEEISASLFSLRGGTLHEAIVRCLRTDGRRGRRRGKYRPCGRSNDAYAYAVADAHVDDASLKATQFHERRIGFDAAFFMPFACGSKAAEVREAARKRPVLRRLRPIA